VKEPSENADTFDMDRDLGTHPGAQPARESDLRELSAGLLSDLRVLFGPLSGVEFSLEVGEEVLPAHGRDRIRRPSNPGLWTTAC
jgi:hypothetical protein